MRLYILVCVKFSRCESLVFTTNLLRTGLGFDCHRSAASLRKCGGPSTLAFCVRLQRGLLAGTCEGGPRLPTMSIDSTESVVPHVRESHGGGLACEVLAASATVQIAASACVCRVIWLNTLRPGDRWRTNASLSLLPLMEAGWASVQIATFTERSCCVEMP